MRILMIIIGILLIAASGLEFSRTIAAVGENHKIGAWITLAILLVIGIAAIAWGVMGHKRCKARGEKESNGKKCCGKSIEK